MILMHFCIFKSFGINLFLAFLLTYLYVLLEIFWAILRISQGHHFFDRSIWKYPEIVHFSTVQVQFRKSQVVLSNSFNGKSSELDYSKMVKKI